MAETIITILNRRRREAARRKSVAFPGRRAEDAFRRKQGAINFYDLAQVNTGTVDSPVWSDHPLLLAPGYTVDADDDFGFQGVIYYVDGFGASDYQAYTDMMFGVAAVEDWRHHFRKLYYEGDAVNSAFGSTYPGNLAVWPPPQTGSVDVYPILDVTADISTEAGRAARSADLSGFGMVWDSKGLEYRRFTQLTVAADSLSERDWFSLSTGLKDIYKVTSVYDPDAADVGDLTISGKIEVYLMPQITLFMAVGYMGPSFPTGFVPDATEGFDVLGPWYQVAPRHLWPAYTDPSAAQNDPVLNGDFLDYQKARTDAQGSHWSLDGGGSVVTSTADPTVWGGSISSYRAICGSDSVQNFYTVGARTRVATPSGDQRYSCDVPFLTAVVKLRGQFYYVWSLAGSQQSVSESNTFTGLYTLTGVGYDD